MRVKDLRAQLNQLDGEDLNLRVCVMTVDDYLDPEGFPETFTAKRDITDLIFERGDDGRPELVIVPDYILFDGGDSGAAG